MDITVLTAFLAPFLPFLVNAGQKASEKAGEKFGEDAWLKAKAIWAKLHPKVESQGDLKVAAEQVAAKPESDARKAVLQEELETLLKENTELATAIAKIMQAGDSKANSGIQITQNITADQIQMIHQVSGGKVSSISGGQVYQDISHLVVTNGSANPATPTLEPPSKNELTKVKTILVLAANPKGMSLLRLGEEVRKIQIGLERSHYRDYFRIEQRWAVTPLDVRRALLDCQPQIVHFCGHGVGSEMLEDEPQSTRKVTVVSNSMSEPEGLMFEDDTGQTQLVSGAAIASLFALFRDQIEFVVLNSCYSEVQAKEIANYIPYVIGMKRAIGDKTAIEFALGFYDAILAGRSVQFAYDLGCSAIQMEGIPEHLTPKLYQQSA